MKDVKTIRTFKVPVAIPQQWKIQAISKYKMKMNASKELHAHSDVPAVALKQRYEIPTPENAPHLLDEYCKKEHELRQELHSMNSVRGSLLWLLKKSARLDICRNHKVSNQ